MRHNFSRRMVLACAAVWIASFAGCSHKQESVVDDAALRAADGDTADWMTYGRTYSEQRFSPLKTIDEQSVSKLGLAWSYDLDTLRGVEATPLVKDGVMYGTSAWSVVYAFDAKTGTLRRG
jgi:quinohemoprotein ethanol dehydrogenase